MSEDPNDIPPEESPEGMVNFLKRQRDELRLKMHLGGKDAQDQWEKLEEKWHDLEEWGEPLTGATKDAAGAAGDQARKVTGAAKDVAGAAGQQARKLTGAAMDLAAREIRSGYEKLRNLLD